MKVLNAKLKSTVNLLSLGIERAISLKPDIIHLSLGSSKTSDVMILKLFIEKAIEAGITIVAAYNNNNTFTYPAHDKDVFGVVADYTSKMEPCQIERVETPFKDIWICSVNDLNIQEINNFPVQNCNSYATAILTGYKSLEKDVASIHQMWGAERQSTKTIGYDVTKCKDDGVETICCLLNESMFTNSYDNLLLDIVMSLESLDLQTYIITNNKKYASDNLPFFYIEYIDEGMIDCIANYYCVDYILYIITNYDETNLSKTGTLLKQKYPMLISIREKEKVLKGTLYENNEKNSYSLSYPPEEKVKAITGMLLLCKI